MRRSASQIIMFTLLTRLSYMFSLRLIGKTKQIVRFIPWLNVLASEMNSPKRKPNFQGPSIKIDIDEASWQDFKGDIKGFQSSTGPPKLGDGTSVSDGEATMDSQAMAGTDESV